MNKLKTWLPHEDNALLELYQERNVKKWAKVSSDLARQYGIRKNAKQCRERYKNHLNPSINKEKWSPEEEKELLQIQSSMGNRWAQISRKMSGRTDNSVKNKFYSLFRRSIANINVLTRKQNFKRRQLQMSFIYKLVSFLDSKLKGGNSHSEDLLQQVNQLRYAILKYGNVNMESFVASEEELTQLFKQVNSINSYFKKKIVKRSGRRFSARQQMQIKRQQQQQSKRQFGSPNNQLSEMKRQSGIQNNSSSEIKKQSGCQKNSSDIRIQSGSQNNYSQGFKRQCMNQNNCSLESQGRLFKMRSDSGSGKRIELFLPQQLQKIQLSTGNQGVSIFSWNDNEEESEMWKFPHHRMSFNSSSQQQDY